MIPYLIRRALIAVPLVFAMTFVIYAVITWQGYSAFDQLAQDPSFTKRDLERMKREARLYDPIPVRYLHWLRGVLFDVRIGHPRHPLADFESDVPFEENGLAPTDSAAVKVEHQPRRHRFAAAAKGSEGERAFREAKEGYWIEVAFPGGREEGIEIRKFLSPYAWKVLPGSDWRLEPGEVEARLAALSPEARRSLPEARRLARAFRVLELDLKNLGASPASVAVEVEDGAGRRSRTSALLAPGRLETVRIASDRLRGDGLDLGDVRAIRVVSALPGRVAVDEVELVEERFPLSAGLPNFGTSFFKHRPVFELISGKVKNTILLTLGAICLTWMVAIPIGVYSAVRPYSAGDRFFSLLAFVGMAMPSFFLALLVIFCVRQVFYDLPSDHPFFRILPTDGRTSPDHEELSVLGQYWDIARHMILPMVVISMSGWAGTMRVMRANMLEVKTQPFIVTARAKGLPERWVLFKHCLRNALLPFVASFGSILPAMMGGSAFVEILFAFPGIGQEMLSAVQLYDINVVMAASFLSGMLLVAGNMLSDVLLAWVDPRISYS